ncbi:MAG: hypothetical protein C5B55_01065 [Blastocatellia bacterium]|nr:MAG: hypothetical protein C5B55_01065 [Blastocatellia bacterium]
MTTSMLPGPAEPPFTMRVQSTSHPKSGMRVWNLEETTNFLSGTHVIYLIETLVQDLQKSVDGQSHLP